MDEPERERRTGIPATPRPHRFLPVALLVAVLSACGSGVPQSSSPPAATVTVSAQAPSSSVAPPPETAPAEAGPTGWTMPDLVGSNLQDAQDAIQKLTGDRVFFTKSHDATGVGRHQILDRDWKVCSQNVKPGATITSSTVIDFAAAKVSESC